MPAVTNNSGIHTCPVELLWQIFLALRPDFKSILICRAVCRQFQESVDSSVEIQLALRLDAWDYVETGSLETPPSHLLQILEAHVEAWRTLNWTESRLDIPYGAAYDLAQGFYVAVDNSNMHDITCVRLPSRTSHSEVHVHTLPNVGFTIYDVTIDPSQDLVVLLEM